MSCSGLHLFTILVIQFAIFSRDSYKNKARKAKDSDEGEGRDALEEEKQEESRKTTYGVSDDEKEEDEDKVMIYFKTKSLVTH